MESGAQDQRRLWRELLRRRATHRWGNFSWVSLNTLLLSANDAIAKQDSTIVNNRRMRWVAAQRERGIDPYEPIRLKDARKLLALGDPGEMDSSQYVLVRDIAEARPDVLLLMSDIVYPAGNVDAWRDAVYLPYFGWPAEVWEEANEAAGTAVEIPNWHVLSTPGNHDWYDGLTGFMYHACGAEPLPSVTYSTKGLTLLQRITRRMWQEPSRPDRAMLAPLRHRAATRWKPEQGPGPMPWQPGPYFALDLGEGDTDPGETEPNPSLRLVCVDTGVDGSIDVEQALWVRKMLEGRAPKIVVTGKPLVTGDRVHDMPIRRAAPRAGREEPQDLPTGLRQLIVEGRNVVATLAGDIHNSQRVVFAGAVTGEPNDWKVQVTDATLAQAGQAKLPPVQIVAGGGGAYLSETHTTPYQEKNGLELAGDDTPAVVLTAKQHTRFPSREQSAALFAKRAGPWAGLVLIVVAVLVLVAAIAVAALDESGSLVCVKKACVEERVVLVAPFVLFALAAFGGLLVAAVRSKRWKRLWWLVPATVALAALAWVTWDHDLADAPVLLGALGFAVFAPLLPLIIPLLQFFPALARLVPLRTIAVLLGGLLIQQLTEIDLRNLRVIIALLVGVAALVLAAGWAIPRILRFVDDLAVEHKWPALRAGLAVLSLWPLAFIGLAIFLVSKQDGWDHAWEAATMIVLIELVVLLAALCFVAARAIASTARFAPVGVLVAAALLGLAGGVAAGLIIDLTAGEWWLTLLLGAAGAVFGSAVTFGAVLAASVDPVADPAITAALRARDHDEAGARDRHLFRLMTVAAVHGISEMAEATKPEFHKSYLEITYETRAGRTTEITFTAFGVDDERGEDGPAEASEEPRARGAYVVDRLTLELGLDVPAQAPATSL